MSTLPTASHPPNETLEQTITTLLTHLLHLLAPFWFPTLLTTYLTQAKTKPK